MNWVVIAFALPVVGLALFALSAQADFSDFCKQVAAAEGRLDELNSSDDIDDGSTNAFEREQRRRLLNEDFEGHADPAIALSAKTVSKKVITSLVLTSLYVTVLGVALFFRMWQAA